ncbi:alpha-mannosidase [Elysia marginata]|uniref:Alpha-mannosidase n=1 Tax=Elysia marginata TaxID=1093978 RepID=A0AAV4IHH2_9GAST|nr:alpha-mannosidase [Elysia marginata]
MAIRRGTEKQVVAFDYAQRMSRGQAAAQKTANEAYSKLISKGKDIQTPVQQIYCDYRNVSVCSVTQQAQNFQVTMYNPLTWAVNYTARVPVEQERYTVLSHDGHTLVASDVFTVTPAPSGIRPKGLNPAARELVFNAQLPPLGFVTHFVQAETFLKWRPTPKHQQDERTIRGKSDVAMRKEGSFSRISFQ